MGETMLVPSPRQPLSFEAVRVEPDARVERMQAVLEALLDYE